MSNAEYKAWKRYIKKIILVKENGDCCSVCKNKFKYSYYDFHHTDPNEKEIEVSRLAENKLELMREEVDKCIVVCKSCHFEIHNKSEQNFPDEEKISKIIDEELNLYLNKKGDVKFKKLIKRLQE